jgi:hypothetical protein
MDSSANHISCRDSGRLPASFRHSSVNASGTRTGTSTSFPNQRQRLCLRWPKTCNSLKLLRAASSSCCYSAQQLAHSHHMMHFFSNYIAWLHSTCRTVGHGRRIRSWHVLRVISEVVVLFGNLARAARLPRCDATAEQLLAEA